jgi:O-methyltransferase domain
MWSPPSGSPTRCRAALRSVEELADACPSDVASLRRVMRALSSFGLFAEDSTAHFSLTSMGGLLKSAGEGSLHPAALFFGGERAAREVGLFLKCVRVGKSMPDMLFGGGWTEWMQSEPEQNKLFNDVMTAFSSINLAALFEAYDFAGLKKIIDVGGGYGRILIEILSMNPGMQGVLFDMAHAFEGGRKTLEIAGLAGRCEVISGDFFSSVPSGADAILENMLHPAEKAIYPVLSDLNMLIRTGGCERTEAEYRSLYRAAGFEHTKTVTTKSPMGTTVIEGRPI